MGFWYGPDMGYDFLDKFELLALVVVIYIYIYMCVCVFGIGMNKTLFGTSRLCQVEKPTDVTICFYLLCQPFNLFVIYTYRGAQAANHTRG